ncbi:MAG TPA: carbohydrate kinase family protein [Pirellulales bacterium]|nr:carbohydrate kinase family protein [Pirellulales bacterium]
MALDCLSLGILVADHLCTPIARVPLPGEIVFCDALPLSIGGCAANVATDLARVGVEVGVVGCVGRDPFGQYLIQTLHDRGVDTSGVTQLADVGTAASLVLNVQGEDRRFIHAIGANARFTAESISQERVRQAKILYVGGYLLMPALNPHGELTRLFHDARRHGVKTVLDVVCGPGALWPQLEELLSETDVFLPNDHEAAAITGLSDPLAQAEQFRRAGCGTVAITRGEQGTLLVSERTAFQAGVYPTTFVGGTGAGDAFDAGYITGMLLGEDEIGCVKWGSALGASCVRSVSATDGVFTRAEASEFIRRQELRIDRL